jgi:hypothetical protein
MSILVRFGTLLLCVFLSAAVCGAQDFASYRGFRLGSSVEEVTSKIGSTRSRLTVIHEQPALIEDFEWYANRTPEASAIADSLRAIRFSFYNHALFRMLVTYDPSKTQGLTTEDVIDAIGGQYGKPGTSTGMVIVSPLGNAFPAYEAILAEWETDQYSYRLFRSSFGSTFGLVIVGKAVQAQAVAASEQSLAQDQLDAPRKELERRKQQDTERREADAKARMANKPKFRP